RIALAEALNARVVTDLKIGCAFPTDHPLYAGATRGVAPDSFEADVVLSLDWVDLGGALKGGTASFKIIQVTLDQHLHNGWSMDYQALPRVDLSLSADPDVVVPALLEALGASAKPRYVPSHKPAEPKQLGEELTTEQLAHALRQAVGDR